MCFVWVYMEKVELRYWWEHSDEKNMNKLVERKAFVDTYGIKSAKRSRDWSSIRSDEGLTLETPAF